MKLLLALTDQSFTATKSVGIFNVSMGLASFFARVLAGLGVYLV